MCLFNRAVATVDWARSSALVPVRRDEFLEERAECQLCGAFVKPVGDMTRMLVQRRFGAGASAGQCPVCELVTYFALI